MKQTRVKNRPAHIQSIDSFDKDTKAIQWEKENFSTNETVCAGTIRSMVKKMKPWPLPHTTTKLIWDDHRPKSKS